MNTHNTKNQQLEAMINIAINSTPSFEYCPELDPKGCPGVHAIWIDGAELDGIKTKVFAYIGLPEGACTAAKCPGVVLHSGGTGHPYPEWVSIWNKRGYAAITVANTGYYPDPRTGAFVHTLPSSSVGNDSRILPPDNDAMRTAEGPIDKMWMYHAVTQTVLANSILRSDTRVDESRVGISGISWGSIITSISIGYDDRFAFAIPVYGSGYLDESLGWISTHFKRPGVMQLWDASLRFDKVKMPVFWLAWPNDTAFSIGPNDRSFESVENSALAFLMNWDHSNIHGREPEEIYRFADSIVLGAYGLTTCISQPGKERNISFEIKIPEDADKVSAKVYYITEKMSYTAPPNTAIEQRWFSSSANVCGSTVTAQLPGDAYSYYVEMTTSVGDKSYITTTRFITIEK